MFARLYIGHTGIVLSIVYIIGQIIRALNTHLSTHSLAQFKLLVFIFVHDLADDTFLQVIHIASGDLVDLFDIKVPFLHVGGLNQLVLDDGLIGIFKVPLVVIRVISRLLVNALMDIFLDLFNLLIL